MNNKKRKKTGRKVIMGSIIVLVAVGIIGAVILSPKKADYTEITPVKGDITTYYSFSGSVEAKNKQSVFSDKAVQIKEIKVTDGQKVNEDDVLMTTTAGEEIKAKIDGEISNIYAEENAQLMPGAKIIDIVDYSNLQLKVQVDEYDLSAVSANKDTTVTIHALDKDVTGKIENVSKEGIYQNGVTFFTATISLTNDSAIRVGMSAEAKVLNKSVKNVTTLPMSAIQFDENNKAYVNIKNGDKPPKRVDTELGISDGVTVEIKSGITTNDTVLVEKKASTGFGRMAGNRMSDNSSSNSGTGANGGGGK